MIIKVAPKDIKYSIRLNTSEKFGTMNGSLFEINGYEIGMGPYKVTDNSILFSMTDLRTGVRLFKFFVNPWEFSMADTRGKAIELYKSHLNKMSDELIELIFNKADETLDKYDKAPKYEFLEVTP